MSGRTRGHLWTFPRSRQPATRARADAIIPCRNPRAAEPKRQARCPRSTMSKQRHRRPRQKADAATGRASAFKNISRTLSRPLPAGAGATTVNYKHNAFGERVSRIEGAATTHFHYDQDGRLIAESDGTGAVIREYLWLGDKPLSLIVGPVSSATLYFVHADHLERVQKITETAQAIVWDGQFTPYGRTHAITGTIQNPLRFPGQWADPAASYFYNYMRDYDPTLGRYLSVDPVRTSGARNRFGYADANPQSLIDVNGQQT